MKLPIYLDYNATTPVDPKVVDAMVPYFTESYGNAASRNHSFGWQVEKVVEDARELIGKLICAGGKEIVFTSGATESNNLAILGAAEFYKKKGKHIISSPIEHKAVIDPCNALEQNGYEITFLDVDKHGCIDLKQLEESIREDTILVSLMAGNNEIGTLNPIWEIGQITRKKDVLFHTDATQCVGKIPIDVEKMNIDLLSMTAHKFYGPKGIGALYVRRKKPRVRLSPIMFGGGHERGMRSGTLNVPGIVGFAKALELSIEEMASEAERLTGLRQRLLDRLNSELDYIFLNGHPTERLPNNLNVSFGYVEGESLMMGVNELAVSSGSACTSASLEPSYVLRALGVGDDLAHSSIRVGMGRFTTVEEIDYAADKMIEAVKRLREMSPLYEMVKDGVDLSTVQWTSH
ncbi:MAG: IscS subfamily cysteine desulfurase [Deltaproteobacteria bacterium]|nr:IscS subfamily cysteine desulfurase [Deltaproteobacteria bacterium]|tara:strand:+ start:7518 stop:8732 length:1215 start_codon:yes stop_codon:yes gene_type:complete